VIHPVSVALTLTRYKADPTTIIAALLHDVIEDTPYTYNDIKDRYGTEVANLVEGLTKIQKIQYSDQENTGFMEETEYTSNFQKMLFSMSKDIRVIWIKLSDRLNNMQTLKYLPVEKQIRISKTTANFSSKINTSNGEKKLSVNTCPPEIISISTFNTYGAAANMGTRPIASANKHFISTIRNSRK
jgi:GTP pyrophosphokinase